MQSDRREIKTSHSPRRFEANTGRLYTTSETAAYLRIDVKTLARHVRAGEIEHLTIGAGQKRPRRRFTEDQILRFVAQRSSATQKNCVLDTAQTAANAKSAMPGFYR